MIIDKDKGWKKISTDLLSVKKMQVKTGYFGSGGTPKDDLAARAAVHEFGDQKRFPPQPPKRSFVRPAFDTNMNIYMRAIQKEIKNNRPLKLIADILGVMATADIKKYIKKGKFVPLAEATIQKKGSSKPLIDRGDMINGVKYEIEVI